MNSLEKKRQIERWARNVAACANGIDELNVNEAPSQRSTQTSGTDRSETSATSYYTTSRSRSTFKPVASTTPPPRKDPHTTRIVVQPSSSEGSAKIQGRNRSIISSRPVVVNTSGSTSRSKLAYAGSRESSAPRPKSPPRSSRDRHPTSPSGTYPKYNVIPRIIKPSPPQIEISSRYYIDERPRRYKEEQLPIPSPPSKPSRPRPRSMDSRSIYYSRPRSPTPPRATMRSPPPQKTTYRRVYDNLPRRTISVRGRSDACMVRRWEEEEVGPNSARRLSELYDDVDKLRSIGARRVYPVDDSRGRRRRSLEYSNYDDYDYDYYDGRRLVS